MIKGGKGGALTQSGLVFESRVDIKVVFENIKDYSVEGSNLCFKGGVIGQLYKKHDIYSILLPLLHIDWTSKISKKLLPDQALMINDTLFVIEVKFQEVEGSVDEKLQTCDFKKKEYEKLFAGSKVKIEYVYVLCDWFKNPRYKDVLDYIASVGCHYFFETLPLSFLNLPESQSKTL